MDTSSHWRGIAAGELAGLCFAMLALVAVSSSCRDRNDADLLLGQALASEPPPSTATEEPDAPHWIGDALPVTELGADALSEVDLSLEDSLYGIRGPGGWFVSEMHVVDSVTAAAEFALVFVPDDGPTRVVGDHFETAPRLARAGGDVLVGFEAPGGEGPSRLLRVERDGLEELGLPLGHVAAASGRLFVATGWELTARTYEIMEWGPHGPVTLHTGPQAERIAGLVVLGDRLVAGVQRLDRSGDAPFDARVSAAMELVEGRPQAAAALAGSVEGYLLTVDLADGIVDSEAFPGQRPQILAALDGGWLVVVGEGTLGGGLRDAVVLARAPGETSGWRLLAESLEMPADGVSAGRWLCFKEMRATGEAIHCLSPELGRHVTTPAAEQGVRLWDIAVGEEGPKLVFAWRGPTFDQRHLSALALEGPGCEEPPRLEPEVWGDPGPGLVDRGVDVGAVRFELPDQMFTTRHAHSVHLSVGNRAAEAHDVVFTELRIEGGRMPAPREADLEPDDVLLSTAGSTSPPVVEPADGGGVLVALPAASLVNVSVSLPAGIDPDLDEATYGTCYTVTVAGSVDATPFQTSASLCYATRIPLR